MRDITARGRIPLLVGGTMLYFRALQQGLSVLPEADPGIRARLDAEAAHRGWDALHRRLEEVDPDAAARVHPNDPQRIQRALEVYEITGRPMSRLQREEGTKGPLPYNLLKLVRAPRDRAVLHERIESRFRGMLEAGFEQEVRGLWARGDLRPEMPSMRSVGYRQMLKYLCGEHTFDVMVMRGVIATRQLAKRQFTWLRAESDCIWLYDGDLPCERARDLVRTFRL
jgi:tRNA dimethylallyltransferase